MPIEGVTGPGGAQPPAGSQGADGPGRPPFQADVDTQAQFEQALGQAFAQVLAPMVQMIMANTGE